MDESICLTSNQVKDRVIDRLKEEYSKGKISYEKLAEQINYSKTHIYHLIKGKRGANLTLETALKIWEGLGEKPENLFQGVGDSLFARILSMTDITKREVIVKLIDILEAKGEKTSQTAMKILFDTINTLHSQLSENSQKT